MLNECLQLGYGVIGLLMVLGALGRGPRVYSHLPRPFCATKLLARLVVNIS